MQFPNDVQFPNDGTGVLGKIFMNQANQQFGQIFPQIPPTSLCEFCQKRVPGDSLQLHKLKCGIEPVQCRKCKLLLERGQVVQHRTVCPNVPVSCPGCFSTMERCKEPAHQSVCPDVRVNCTECKKEVKRGAMPDHLTYVCQEKQIKCPDCDAPLLRKNLATHQETCDEHVVACKMCQGPFKQKEKENHWIYDCMKVPIKCDCGKINLREDYREHVKMCPKVYVLCKYRFSNTVCMHQTERQLMPEHEQSHEQKKDMDAGADTASDVKLVTDDEMIWNVGLHYDVQYKNVWYMGQILEKHQDSKMVMIESVTDSQTFWVKGESKYFAPSGTVTKYGFYPGKIILAKFSDHCLERGQILHIAKGLMSVRRITDDFVEEQIPMTNEFCTTLDFHKQPGVIACVSHSGELVTGQICNVGPDSINIKIIRSRDDLNQERGEIDYSPDKFDKFVESYPMIYGKKKNLKRSSSWIKDQDTGLEELMLWRGLQRFMTGQ
jgi:hypothetical protein